MNGRIPIVVAMSLVVSIMSVNIGWSAPSHEFQKPGSPDNLSSYQRGQILFGEGKYNDAKAVFSAAVAKEESSQIMNQFDLAKDLVGLAEVLAQAKDYQNAIADTERAVSILQKIKSDQRFLERAINLLSEFKAKASSAPVASSSAIAVPDPRFFINWAGANGIDPRDANQTESRLKAELDYALKASGASSTQAVQKRTALANYYYAARRTADAKAQVVEITSDYPKLGEDDKILAATSLLQLSSAAAREDMSSADQLLNAALSAVVDSKRTSREVSEHLRLIAQQYASIQRYDKARIVLQKAIAMDEAASSPTNASVLAEKETLAGIEDAAGNKNEAQRLYAVVLNAQERLCGAGNGKTVYILCTLANSYLDTGKVQEAQQLVPRIAAAAKNHRMDESSSYQVIEQLISLAAQFSDKNDFVNAQSLALAALTHPSSDGEASLNEHAFDEGLQTLQTAYEDAGKVAELESLYRTLRDSSAARSGDSGRLFDADARLATFYVQHDQFDKAKISADEAVKLQANCDECDLTKVATIASAFQHKRKNHEAEQYYLAFLNGMPRGKDPDIPKVVQTWITLSDLYRQDENPDKAATALKNATAAITVHLPADAKQVESDMDVLISEMQKNCGTSEVDQFVNGLARNFYFGHGCNSDLLASIYQAMAAKFERFNSTKSVELYKKALDVTNRQYGDKAIQSLQVLEGYARALRKSGKDQDGAKLESLASEIRERSKRQSEARMRQMQLQIDPP